MKIIINELSPPHPHHFCKILSGKQQINYHWPHAHPNYAGIIAGLGLYLTLILARICFKINELRLLDYQGNKHVVETVKVVRL